MTQEKVAYDHRPRVWDAWLCTTDLCRYNEILLLEVELDRPLQWFICQLHANELLLRHLFQHIDWPTSGPKDFAGPIGKSIVNCEKLPVLDYEPLNYVLHLNIDSNDLSTDQKYLFDMCTVVSLGDCPLDHSLRNPGLINHNRWLTMANRILRLYVATVSPSDGLKMLAIFILTVYTPMWFEIKSSPLYTCRWCSTYSQQNTQVMIPPPRPKEGCWSLQRILKARLHLNTGKGKVRSFKVPVINFEATPYIDLIDWQTIPVTEPPLTTDIDDGTLSDMIRKECPPKLEFGKYPCHTQAVEWHIKLVTEASELVCGADSRFYSCSARIKI